MLSSPSILLISGFLENFNSKQPTKLQMTRDKSKTYH